MRAAGIDSRALHAIALTRAQGMHLLGHFVGITGEPAPTGEARLFLRSTEGEIRAPDSYLAFSVFADLCLGSAIRSRIEAGARLGTATLSIQHRAAPGSGVVGLGCAPAPTNEYGIAQARFLDGDRVVAHAQASASALPAPPGRNPRLLPWEVDRIPTPAPVAEDELDPIEARFLANVRQAASRAEDSGATVEDELLRFDWRASKPQQALGELTIGPELSNRVGHVQGGALYAAGATAAEHVLGDGWQLAEGAYQFLRPSEGTVLAARPTVRRRGRTLAFTETELSVDDVLVGVGLYVFRADSHA